ncbi:MAG TPA: hypothetical protein PKD17_10655, partial [Cellvibrionaceae bacterium]|nr:hypothetical protein [Cellvibrionaceae bacterium]
MNVFSSLRVSQKILLLVAWLALGFAALGVAYYWQVDQEAKVRETAQNYSLFEKFLQQGRGHLQDFIANSYLGAASEELKASQEAFISTFNHAQLLAKKEPSLPNPQTIVSAFEALQAASTPGGEAAPIQQRYAEEKIRTQFKILEAIVKQRAKPQELAAWVELQRLHEGFMADRQEVSLASLQGFVRDFSTTQKSVLRPD